MKIRIKFSKHGPLKFIGHLDIMRYFQKVMRRAEIAIKYSEGMSPHQIMSFAAPLGVGLESDGEYLDIEVTSTYSSKEAIARLNSAMAEGIQISAYKLLDEKIPNAMSSVAAADYSISIRENYEPKFAPKGISDPEFAKAFNTLYHQDSIVIMKKTKSSEKEIDLKPYIHMYAIEDNSFIMRLSAGSEVNIKPELVIKALYHSMSEELPEFALCITRKEIYALDPSTKELITLENMGHDLGEEYIDVSAKP